MESVKPTVIVSGFGPFGVYTVNPSWESVKKMSKLDLEKDFDIQFITVEIPVVYDTVDALVPTLWKQYHPLLFVHVGVSGLAKELTLETIANGQDYRKLDQDGKLPQDCMNASNADGCNEISCKLDVLKICEDFNKTSKGICAHPSKNAGRFLCEYTYFTSLSINPLRTLFVHVPEFNCVYTREETAKGLDKIIRLCLLQLQHCECIAT
ncbi:pyroglutamyl-peptidase 1 [Arctopsyche grandis]|uniref:pyroglutamyl-peptidase 1 n=1 Tax=Arctopsyche grandis TaxID=121162 RepID=UPI00406D72C0